MCIVMSRTVYDCFGLFCLQLLTIYRVAGLCYYEGSLGCGRVQPVSREPRTLFSISSASEQEDAMKVLH